MGIRQRIADGWEGNRRALSVALALAAAFAAVRWGIALCVLDEAGGLPFWMWPVVAACGYANLRFLRLEKGRTRRLALAFSLAFLFFQILGRQYDFSDYAGTGMTAGGWTVWLQCLGVSALLAPTLAWPLAELMARLRRPAVRRPAARLTDGRFLAVCMLVLMLMWQPYHWAYFPGLVEYDSGYQLWQSWNRLYNASNPLFHTLILGAFYLTGEKIATTSGGIAAFCFVQRLFVSGCIGYALMTLRRNRAPLPWLIASLVFFGALPVFGMLAISCTKDVPFYALALVQLAMIFDGCRNSGRACRVRYWVAIGLVTTLMCLIRANALAAFFLLVPLVCLACRNRGLRRGLAAFMLAGVALAWAVNALLIAALGADRPLMRESLSVPILQLARVDCYHSDVDEDLSQNHAELVQTPLTYIPHVADLSKWAFTVDWSNLGEFTRLWAKYLVRYPRDYLDTFLLLTKGYWYLGDDTHARVYGDALEQRAGLIASRVSPDIDTIVEDCRLPGLKDHLERMYSANEYRRIPVYRLLLCPALYVWLLVFAAVCAAEAGRWDVRVVTRYALLFLIALLLGPCCIIRYALLYMLLGPVLVGMLLTPADGMLDPAEELSPFRDIRGALSRLRSR